MSEEPLNLSSRYQEAQREVGRGGGHSSMCTHLYIPTCVAKTTEEQLGSSSSTLVWLEGSKAANTVGPSKPKTDPPPLDGDWEDALTGAVVLAAIRK